MAATVGPDKRHRAAARGDNQPRPPVTIGVDRSSNALIISATRQDLDNIETLIKKLMTSTGRGDAEFHIFTLVNADPQAVAQTLLDLYNPKLPTLPPGGDFL